MVGSLPSAQISRFHDNLTSTKSILTTLLCGQPIDRVIALACPPDESAERKSGVAPRDRAPFAVDVCDRDLHRCVVLGLDKPAGRRALARDVKVNKLALLREETESVFVTAHLEEGETGGRGTTRRFERNHQPVQRSAPLPPSRGRWLAPVAWTWEWLR